MPITAPSPTYQAPQSSGPYAFRPGSSDARDFAGGARAPGYSPQQSFGRPASIRSTGSNNDIKRPYASGSEQPDPYAAHFELPDYAKPHASFSGNRGGAIEMQPYGQHPAPYAPSPQAAGYGRQQDPSMQGYPVHPPQMQPQYAPQPQQVELDNRTKTSLACLGVQPLWQCVAAMIGCAVVEGCC